MNVKVIIGKVSLVAVVLLGGFVSRVDAKDILASELNKQQLCLVAGEQINGTVIWNPPDNRFKAEALSRGITLEACKDYFPNGEFEDWLEASVQGSPSAQSELGSLYWRGQGVTKDYREAVKWYHKAAAQGDAYALYSLGFAYLHGRGVTTDFRVTARVPASRWYRMAAVQGFAPAQYEYGMLLKEPGSHFGAPDVHGSSKEAFSWIKKAASQGHKQAEKTLVEITSYREEERTLLSKAKKGDAEAQHSIGIRIQSGRSWLFPMTDLEASKWYAKAANQGYSEAQSVLGEMYATGNMDMRNYRLAIKWLTKAATQGLPSAQRSLGKMYGAGLGVVQDEVEALKWLYLSSSQDGGTYERDDQIEKMTPGQIAQARRLAKAWRPGSSDTLAPSPAPAVTKPNKALLAALAPIREAHRDAIAVVIGNKAYKGETPHVSYAISDATAISAMLRNRLGYRVGNIIDLRDATLNDMAAMLGNERAPEGKLHDWIRPGQSDVFVFYSGHGVPGLKDKRPYLLPVDGDANRAEITGYPLDVLYKNLAMLPAKSVTVFIDACFSGDSPKGMIVKSASGISLEAKLPESAKSMTVITAAQGDQLASWDEKARHGLFTKHLLEALEGKADSKRYGDEDGKVSLAEVRNYLDQEMTYQARRRFGRTQKASVRGAPDTVLATVLDLPDEEDDGIEEMDAHYKVLKTANIRSGPGTSHDIVGKLEVNQSVNVTGKAIGKNWFRLGDGTFVFGSLIGPVN
jgi:TPR repeat protein